MKRKKVRHKETKTTTATRITMAPLMTDDAASLIDANAAHCRETDTHSETDTATQILALAIVIQIRKNCIHDYFISSLVYESTPLREFREFFVYLAIVWRANSSSGATMPQCVSYGYCDCSRAN